MKNEDADAGLVFEISIGDKLFNDLNENGVEVCLYYFCQNKNKTILNYPIINNNRILENLALSMLL